MQQRRGAPHRPLAGGQRVGTTGQEGQGRRGGLRQAVNEEVLDRRRTGPNHHRLVGSVQGLETVLPETRTPVDRQSGLEQAAEGDGIIGHVALVLRLVRPTPDVEVDRPHPLPQQLGLAVERGSHIATTARGVEDDRFRRLPQDIQDQAHSGLELSRLVQRRVRRRPQAAAQPDGHRALAAADLQHLLDRRPARPLGLRLAQVEDEAPDIELSEGEQARQVVVVVRVSVRVEEVRRVDDRQPRPRRPRRRCRGLGRRDVEN